MEVDPHSIAVVGGEIRSPAGYSTGYRPCMRRKNGDPAKVRYLRLDMRVMDRRSARLTRLDDPMTAEDDYFRLANRNR